MFALLDHPPDIDKEGSSPAPAGATVRTEEDATFAGSTAAVVLEDDAGAADAPDAADARRERSNDSYARASLRFTADASAREPLAALTSRT